jgi:hypothetical protein
MAARRRQRSNATKQLEIRVKVSPVPYSQDAREHYAQGMAHATARLIVSRQSPLSELVGSATDPLFFLTRSSKSVHWILHQEFGLQRRRHSEPWYGVDQHAVIGHMRLHVGMRPVSAPQHAIGKLLHEPTAERDDVIIRGPLDRDPLLAVDLGPDTSRCRARGAQRPGSRHRQRLLVTSGRPM